MNPDSYNHHVARADAARVRAEHGRRCEARREANDPWLDCERAVWVSARFGKFSVWSDGSIHYVGWATTPPDSAGIALQFATGAGFHTTMQDRADARAAIEHALRLTRG